MDTVRPKLRTNLGCGIDFLKKLAIKEGCEMSMIEIEEQQYLQIVNDSKALNELLSELDIICTELGTELLHEQPVDEMDAIDHEKQWHEALTQVVAGEPDPFDDWKVSIRLVQTTDKKKLQENIDNHLKIALRQIALVSHFNQHIIPQVRKNIHEGVRRHRMLLNAHSTIGKAATYAHQHATAWRMLKDYRDNSVETRSKKAAKANTEIKEEKDALLRALTKWALVKKRPIGGWKDLQSAALDIAISIHPLMIEYGIKTTKDELKLAENLEKTIFKEDSLRNLYNKNAKEELKKPYKIRQIPFSAKIEIRKDI
ncbi:hypothetical protein [Halomonas sp. Cn5-12]|uniref:hypothetical protein n=1 Tax=Halomonas sp. Cn5-12 TaxID=2908885 RepID=UPI001F3179D4|nr:hypothetical protein [Halomonas sp. Cn5-12]MCF2914483.1 hypothetical protein [Halomonas sp. Cn5-12]